MHVVPEPANILAALINALEQPHTITERGGNLYIVPLPPPSAEKNRRRSRRRPVRRFSPIRAMRRQGRNDPAAGMEWVADAGAGVAGVSKLLGRSGADPAVNYSILQYPVPRDHTHHTVRRHDKGE